MSTSRLAVLGVLCLIASACTVVVQPAADQPDPAPRATEPEPDVDVADAEPVRRPTIKEPVRRPPDARPDPDYYEPESPYSPSPGGSTASNLGIPPGHLPPPGQCRVWVPGTPPGQQARSRSCYAILAAAPVGSWILYRPAQYQRQLRVRYLHETQRAVVAVRAFDSETGAYLRDLALHEDDNNMGPLATGERRPTISPATDPTGTPGNSGNAPRRADTTRSRGAAGGSSGVAVGRADTTRNRGAAGNDNGLAVGRPDTTRNRRAAEGNSGVAVGQVDTTKSKPSESGNRGNQGGEDPLTSRGGKSPDQGRGNAATSADTAGSRHNPDVGETPLSPVDTTDQSRTSSANRSIGVAGTRRTTAEVDRRDEEKARDGQESETEDTGLDAGPDASLGIDARYFPDAGKCRVWVPGRPFGRQARPTSCDGIADSAPAGAWILRRTADQPDVILVDYVDAEQTGVVVRTSAFDATTGARIRSGGVR